MYRLYQYLHIQYEIQLYKKLSSSYVYTGTSLYLHICSSCHHTTSSTALCFSADGLRVLILKLICIYGYFLVTLFLLNLAVLVKPNAFCCNLSAKNWLELGSLESQLKSLIHTFHVHHNECMQLLATINSTLPFPHYSSPLWKNALIYAIAFKFTELIPNAYIYLHTKKEQ